MVLFMDDKTKVTMNHGEIQAWAEKYKGKPQLLNTDDTSGHVGLRIDFPGKEDDTYLSEKHLPQNVTWEEFFAEFDRQELAFDYDSYVNPIDPSLSYRFILRANLK